MMVKGSPCMIAVGQAQKVNNRHQRRMEGMNGEWNRMTPRENGLMNYL